MTCCWCGGDHPATGCPEKVTIQEALNILGPIRAIRAHQRFQYDPELLMHRQRQGQIYWLDGKLTTGMAVKKAAIERRRQKNANTSAH